MRVLILSDNKKFNKIQIKNLLKLLKFMFNAEFIVVDENIIKLLTELKISFLHTNIRKAIELADLILIIDKTKYDLIINKNKIIFNTQQNKFIKDT